MKRLTHQGEHGPYWDKAVFDKHGGMEEDLIIDRLAYYEDMEEQGRLVLPCKPGDKVYRVVRWGKGKVAIKERIVSSVEYANGEWVIHSTGNDVLGKKCFLTREEAEKALEGKHETST